MCVYFVFFVLFFFFFKQKTAYEMRISDWSSDVCSSDLSREVEALPAAGAQQPLERHLPFGLPFGTGRRIAAVLRHPATIDQYHAPVGQHNGGDDVVADTAVVGRSEAHTSEFQYLIRTSYEVLCLIDKSLIRSI